MAKEFRGIERDNPNFSLSKRATFKSDIEIDENI